MQLKLAVVLLGTALILLLSGEFEMYYQDFNFNCVSNFLV